jgi:stearoyl-CoA desaturase (delta-9 desaturase)
VKVLVNETVTSPVVIELDATEVSPSPQTPGAPAHTYQKPPSAPLSTRIIYLVAVILPFAGLLTAIGLLWPLKFGWTYIGLLVGMYILTGLGVTVGYHRLFTHRSFETGRVMTFIIGAFGSMAAEGPIITWVATHRKHHQHSDGEEDPHSPHAHGSGFWGMLRGLWHAHMGWLIDAREVDETRYAPDLQRDPVVRALSKTFPLWVALGLLIPAALGGLLTMSWFGVLLGLLWGGFVRIFLVHHVTWSVNSICHIWGAQRFESHDESRNNMICALLSFGEGWHNNHHAFPASARHGLRWWEIDTSYMVIKAMKALGLARNIRTPAPDRIEAKAIR